MNPAPMTDSDIVAGLRDPDVQVRLAALAALYPGSHGIVLLRNTTLQTEATVTPTMDAGRTFNALLYVAQQIGRVLGLGLNWIPEQQPSQKRPIEIVGGYR